MQFQHTTPMPSGINRIGDTSIVGVPQLSTANGNSGSGSTILAGDTADTLSINLIQLLIGWGGLTHLGKFEIRSKSDPPISIFQDKRSGSVVLPLWNIPRFLGDHGLTVLNSATGGEYSITAIYVIRNL